MTDLRSAIHALTPSELPRIGPASMTMGAFDGVHRGHQAMLAATRNAGEARGVRSVAVVFDPHPDEVVRPGTIVPRLAPMGTNLRRIEQDAGIDYALPLRFDDTIRSLAPEDFLAALSGSFELRAIVMSPESAFGRGRTGTAERMRELGLDAGFEVVTVAPVLADGEPISSERIRTAIARGAIEEAAALGYAPYLQGIVVRGDGRGRALGFPTANLQFDYTPALPARGIYVGVASSAERGVDRQPALISVGVRPTFHPDGALLVEAYLLDFDADLYDATLELELLTRQRDERRFEDVEELVSEMRHDEASARSYLARRHA
jgi:riboflavin kinase/FMN adenylyltransferase